MPWGISARTTVGEFVPLRHHVRRDVAAAARAREIGELDARRIGLCDLVQERPIGVEIEPELTGYLFFRGGAPGAGGEGFDGGRDLP